MCNINILKQKIDTWKYKLYALPSIWPDVHKYKANKYILRNLICNVLKALSFFGQPFTVSTLDHLICSYNSFCTTENSLAPEISHLII